MRRVVLFYPAVKFGGSVQPRTELPLSLLTVATPLDRAGYEVCIIDQRVHTDWRTRLERELEDRPVCLGVSAMTGPQIRFGLEASRIARRCGDTPVVWGGIHPTLMPEQTLANDNVDIVVAGEGEETFLELVQILESGGPLTGLETGALDGCPGIWFQQNGEAIHTGARPPVDLSCQPPLAYHLLDMPRYRVSLFGEEHLTLETSRGCAYRCAYCYNTGVYNGTWRALSPAETLERIQRLAGEHDARGIIFADDNFFGSTERALTILREVRAAGLELSFPKVDGHLQVLASLTDDELQLLCDCGCRMLQLGIESTAPRILELLNKKLDIETLLAFNRRLSRFDIRPAYYFMVGYPTETLAELEQTMSCFLQLARENRRAVPRLNIYAPFPGTPLYDECVTHGFEPPETLEGWVSVNYRTVGERSPWLSKERQKLLRMLDFATMLASRSNFIDSYKDTGWLVRLAAALYYPLARRRVENLSYRFPIELEVAKRLGLFPEQTG